MTDLKQTDGFTEADCKLDQTLRKIERNILLTKSITITAVAIYLGVFIYLCTIGV